jgi:hypothetical protein
MQVRKRSLLFLLLLTQLLSVCGQTNEAPIHLYSSRNSIHFNRPFFNRIIVMDNRFDSSRIISYVHENGHIMAVIIDKTFSEAVRGYIEEAAKEAPKNGRTLLLEIRRFEIVPASLLPAALTIKANVYYGRGDSAFIKFGSLEIDFNPIYYRNPKSVSLWIGKALDALLREIDSKDTVLFIDKSGGVALQTIRRENVMNDWGKYPINKADTYPSGVYEFYQPFRRNQVEKFNLRLKMRDDSLYEVTFTDSLSDEKQRVYNWLTITLGQGIISYDGKLYYMIQFPLCVPLKKKNNTFYFQVPASLPNRYYYDLAQSEFGGYRMEPSYDFKDIASNIVGFWISDARWRSIVNEGIKDPTLRDCYIDLDTGVIRYQ